MLRFSLRCLARDPVSLSFTPAKAFSSLCIRLHNILPLNSNHHKSIEKGCRGWIYCFDTLKFLSFIIAFCNNFSKNYADTLYTMLCFASFSFPELSHAALQLCIIISYDAFYIACLSSPHTKILRFSRNFCDLRRGIEPDPKVLSIKVYFSVAEIEID